MTRRFTIQPVWQDAEQAYVPRHEELYPDQFVWEWFVPTWPVAHPQEGQPRFSFGFVSVEAPVASLKVVPSTFVFPEYPLDGLMSGMQSDAKAAMVQSLEAYDWGAPLEAGSQFLDATVDEAVSYRDYLDGIVKQIESVQSIEGLEL